MPHRPLTPQMIVVDVVDVHGDSHGESDFALNTGAAERVIRAWWDQGFGIIPRSQGAVDLVDRLTADPVVDADTVTQVVAWLRGRTGAHGGGFTCADDVADAIEHEFLGAPGSGTRAAVDALRDAGATVTITDETTITTTTP